MQFQGKHYSDKAPNKFTVRDVCIGAEYVYDYL